MRRVVLTLAMAALALPPGMAMPSPPLPAVPPGSFEESWSRLYDGDSGSTDLLGDLVFTADRGVALVGSTYVDSSVGYATLVRKYDPAGETLWTVTDLSASYGGLALALPGGDLLAVGSAGREGLWFVRLDPEGGERWRTHRATAAYAQVYSGWAEEATGDAFVAVGDQASLLLRLRGDGSVAWGRALPTNLPLAVAPLGDGLLLVGSNGFRVYLWQVGLDGSILAERSFDSNIATGDAARLGGVVVVAGRPRSFAVDASLAVVWERDLEAYGAAASGGRVTLLGPLLATLDAGGALCAVSPRPFLRNQVYGLLYTPLTGHQPEEHLAAVARAPGGAIALGGIHWTLDEDGSDGDFDVLTVLGSDVGGDCGGP